jgi:hypothetical protein
MADITESYDLNLLAEIPSFEPIPAGTYPCRIVEVKFDQTQKGDDRITLICEVSEGEYEGRKVFHGMIQKDNCLWVTKRTLECLGVTKEQFLEGGVFNWYDTVGEEIGFTLKVDEEREMNNIVRILPIDKVNIKTASQF